MEQPYANRTYFDGTALESLGIIVERVHDDLPDARVELIQYPGMRGSDFVGSTLGPREITLECRAFSDEWQDFEDMKGRLYALVAKPTERKLQLRNHPGQYYMAHYTSFTEGDRVGETGIGAFELAFTASDPARYGEDRAFVLRGTSQQSFDIGGTADATDMVITVSSARPNSTSKAFGMKLNGKTFRVMMTGTTSAVSLVIRPNEMVITDSSEILMYGTTMDTFWPTLEPRRWTVKVTEGSCSNVTFSWKQRYL